MFGFRSDGTERIGNINFLLTWTVHAPKANSITSFSSGEWMMMWKREGGGEDGCEVKREGKSATCIGITTCKITIASWFSHVSAVGI